MRPSPSLAGASRLPLTIKRGNKDFYKGTRQAYVPGGGHRTGPPGKHVVRGTAKYRILDEKVRYFVSPGVQTIENSLLKPYVTTNKAEVKKDEKSSRLEKLPPFGPQPKRADGRKHLEPQDYKRFSKAYAALSDAERAALIHQSRREFYTALTRLTAAQQTKKEGEQPQSS